MNALVPKNLNKNDVDRQSLWRPTPVPFIPPSSELPAVRDNEKYTIKFRINGETEEHVLASHGGVPEAYLQYIRIFKNLIRKKDLHTTFEGYKKEEALAKEDIILNDVNKPEPDVSTENVDVASCPKQLVRGNKGG